MQDKDEKPQRSFVDEAVTIFSGAALVYMGASLAGEAARKLLTKMDGRGR